MQLETVRTGTIKEKKIHMSFHILYLTFIFNSKWKHFNVLQKIPKRYCMYRPLLISIIRNMLVSILRYVHCSYYSSNLTVDLWLWYCDWGLKEKFERLPCLNRRTISSGFLAGFSSEVLKYVQKSYKLLQHLSIDINAYFQA